MVANFVQIPVDDEEEDDEDDDDVLDKYIVLHSLCDKLR